MKIILATHNTDKCKELQKAFKSYKIKIYTLQDFPEIGEIIEDGDSLEENAFIKSRTVFNLTKIPTISDDTGLYVDALNGEPGIFSARYAGENCSYSDNVNKLLINMKNINHSRRTATFKTVVTYVSQDLELVADGSVQGFITRNKKGNKGFGYDPIFEVKGTGLTYAEMGINKKKVIGHRGKAFSLLEPKLKKLLKI